MQKENKMNVDNAKYDSCGVRIIAASDMPVSLWSGGRTTEIYIAPEELFTLSAIFFFASARQRSNLKNRTLHRCPITTG